MAEAKQEFKFPTETVDLPSGGKVYSKDSPLSSGKIDIKYMTAKEEAKHIYHTDYWRRAKCDEVPPHLRHIYFDMCVNFGQGGAVKVLQRAANAKNKEKIEVDGGMGPATLKAIQNLELERVRAYRVLRFANLVINKPEQERFWFGWYRRSMEV